VKPWHAIQVEILCHLPNALKHLKSLCVAQILYTPCKCAHNICNWHTFYVRAAFQSYINVSIYANLYEFMLLPTTANSHKCHVRQFVICVKEVLFVSVWLRFGLVLPSSGSPLQFDWLHTRVLDTKNREEKKSWLPNDSRNSMSHILYIWITHTHCVPAKVFKEFKLLACVVRICTGD